MCSWSICQYLKLKGCSYKFMALLVGKSLVPWLHGYILIFLLKQILTRRFDSTTNEMINISISINVAQISLILGRRNELQHHCRRRNCFIFVGCKNAPWPLPLSAQGNSLIFPEAAVHLEITITTIQPTKVTFFIF